MPLLLPLLLPALLCCSAAVATEEFPYQLQLDKDSTVAWNFKVHSNLAVFSISVPIATRVLGFGFSQRGETTNADFAIVYLAGYAKPIIAGFYSDKNLVLHKQIKNQYQLIDWQILNGKISIVFYRPLAPREGNYYQIDSGTTHLLFFKSGTALNTLKYYEISKKMVQLIKTKMPLPRPEPGAFEMQVRVKDVAIPPDETTYWCKVVQLPTMQRKHHIVGYKPIITTGNEAIVHHLEVFLCVDGVSKAAANYDGPCNSETKPMGMRSCRKVIGAWAMGAEGIFYPEQAGLPIGGKDQQQQQQQQQFAVIEIHYNNEKHRTDLIDSSGLRFFVTPRLRRYDVGIMELGLDYLPNNAIPPGQKQFQLTGYCLPKCTAATLPSQGINIFASQLHTHTSGIEVGTWQGRAGNKQRTVNVDQHYSPHFQEIRLLPKPVRVLPGDSLTTSCTFSSVGRANMTVGGLAISNEMCINYVFYYPKIHLELCKSVVSSDALSKFFAAMKNLFGSPTSPAKSIEQNYNSISWGRMQVEALRNFYKMAPIHQSCNTSAGVEFPGHNWDNLKPLHVNQS